jgi:hypothetical protein
MKSAESYRNLSQNNQHYMGSIKRSITISFKAFVLCVQAQLAE